MKGIVLLLVIIGAGNIGNCLERDKRALIQASSSCTSHDQCPTAQACIHNSCGDPCESLCGENTYCTTLHHIPACACKDGYTGNPFVECTLQATPVEQPASLPRGKKRYQIINAFQLQWLEAFLYCLRNNTRLLAIENLDEFEELKGLTHRNGYYNLGYWTSASDAGSEGNFIWASTGKQISSSSIMWRPGEPNNANNEEHCVALSNTAGDNHYGLDDHSCTFKDNFICEYYE